MPGLSMQKLQEEPLLEHKKRTIEAYNQIRNMRIESWTQILVKKHKRQMATT